MKLQNMAHLVIKSYVYVRESVSACLSLYIFASPVVIFNSRGLTRVPESILTVQLATGKYI